MFLDADVARVDAAIWFQKHKQAKFVKQPASFFSKSRTAWP
jgi:hypothetical protein